MENVEIAHILEEYADLLEISDDNSLPAQSYRKAAQTIGLRAAAAGSPGCSPALALRAFARHHQDDEGEDAESSDISV